MTGAAMTGAAMTGAAVSDGRVPVLLLDSIGYDYYHDSAGRAFLPADRYKVRLVTDLNRVGEAHGRELEAVVGVGRYDEAAYAGAARYLHRFHGEPAAALVAVTERLLLPAAALRDELGVPGPTYQQTLPFRDKVVMKRHLSAHGVAVPDFAPFDLAAATALLAEHKVVVAKPRQGSGSIDVAVLREPADLARFAERNAHRLNDFEVEQYIDGTLYHIDSVVHCGVALAATAGRSLDETTSYLRLEAFRDVGVGEGEVLDRLLAFNRTVLACFPDFSGVTHHEVFLAAGGIYHCEIAGRAGGGGVIAGFLSRTGTNLDEAVLRAQLLDPFTGALAVAGHLTGYVLIYAPAGRLVEPVRVPPADWVIEAQLPAAAGEKLSVPARWDHAVAIVSVRGDDEAQVLARLSRVIDEVRPVVRPE